MMKKSSKDNFAGKTRDQLIEELKRLQKENSVLADTKKALDQTEENFYNVFNGAPDGIILVDEKVKILDVNDAFLEITGFTRAEIIGKTGLYLARKFAAKSVLTQVLRIVKKVLAKEPTVPYTLAFRGKIIEVKSKQLHNSKNSIGIIRDISERHKREEKLTLLKEKAEESEHKFWAIANQSIDGITLADHEGNYTYVNPAFCKMMGYSEEEILQKTVFDMKAPQQDKGSFARSMASHEGVAIQVVLQRKDGSQFTSEVVGKRIIIHDKPFVLGTIRDITKRIKAEEALQEEHERSQKYLDVAGVMFMILNTDGEVTLVNQKGCEILGCQQKEILGKNWFKNFLPESGKKEITSLFSKIIEEDFEPTTYYENHVLSADGSKRLIAWNNTVLRDKNNKVIGTLSSGQDITEQRLAELALQESQRQLATLLNNLPGMVYRCKLDADWTMEFVSEGALSLTGYCPDELIGNSRISYANVIHSDDRQMVWDLVKEAKTTNEPFQLTYRIVTTNGKEKWVWEQGQHIAPTKMKPLILEGFITDINESKIAEEKVTELAKLEKKKTKELEVSLQQLQVAQDATLNMMEDLNREIDERIKIEDKLKVQRSDLEKNVKRRTVDLEKSQASLALLLEDVNESREELKELNMNLEIANKELEAFAYSVSHDLRAPLRHIDGFTKMLKKNLSQTSDKIEYYFEKISESSNSMGEMIDGLLSFSRLGRKSLQVTSVDLNNIVEVVIKQSSQHIAHREIEWKIGKMPVIRADKTLLKLVIENLISNAIKFTSKNEKTLIEIGECNNPDKLPTFFVKDNGVGFDMDYVDNLFGVFQRLHSKDEFEGTGIGLANVKQIVKKHGGDIWAESKVDEGATFYLKFP